MMTKTIKDGKVKETEIIYLMRHKTEKNLYEIKSKSGKSVKITEDHSLMIERDGKVIPVRVKELEKNDKILEIL